MSESEAEKLKKETIATEQAVTGVAQLDGLPPITVLPTPPPPIHGPSKPAVETDKKGSPQSSDEDEFQNTWLSSLDARVKFIEAQASAAIKHAEARGKHTDNSLRKEMADKTFSFMEKWCAFVAFIIFIYVAKHDGDPPKEVILALLGTCTVSIIGLVGFVVSGLFKVSKTEQR